MYWGDMVVATGYPVIVVMMVEITKIEMDATVVPEVKNENLACCFFIYAGEVISLNHSFQIIEELKTKGCLQMIQSLILLRNENG